MVLEHNFVIGRQAQVLSPPHRVRGSVPKKLLTLHLGFVAIAVLFPHPHEMARQHRVDISHSVRPHRQIVYGLEHIGIADLHEPSLIVELRVGWVLHGQVILQELACLGVAVIVLDAQVLECAQGHGVLVPGGQRVMDRLDPGAIHRRPIL